ncbi:unnamed protein product [Cylindrotheca closterium]|uniref:DUF6824 domain-containing protein n=1 Tax=Cylindrotheca closterium TaxID=2856 RepID=A0AAD2JHQ1_9STRA|nr:unnamed protein product [Cylindrotheca closterium]
MNRRSSISDGKPKPEETVSHNQPPSASTRNAITQLTSLDQYTSLRNHRMRFEHAFDINAERVDTTKEQDIIFGRGKSLQDYPGNQRMRQITSKYKNLYRTLPRSQKRNLVESVYKEIVVNGARFLTKAPNATHFLLVDVEVALQKISNSLRCMKEHKRQIVAAMERRNSSDEAVPKASASAATSFLERASIQIHPLPILNPSVTTGSQNLDIYSTLQRLNQCRQLRLFTEACMKSSVAIATIGKVPSVQLSAPRKTAPGAKSNKRPSSL